MVVVTDAVLLTPEEGWGFYEEIDGKLADTFSVSITEKGVDLGHGILGWRGVALDGKYKGRRLEMSPRHIDWTGVVVLKVLKRADRGDLLYSGFAHTEGLERNWE